MMPPLLRTRNLTLNKKALHAFATPERIYSTTQCKISERLKPS